MKTDILFIILLLQFILFRNQGSHILEILDIMKNF